jgi:BMFP domain-containing protein YqiC
MSSHDFNDLSPTQIWRNWFVQCESQWSEALTQLLKDPRVAEPLNRQLSEVQLVHRQFAEYAQASLAWLNLPSRSDLEALDERMGRLEDGLAQVAAALSDLRLALAATSPALAADVQAVRPSRTRRPAKKA